MIALIIGRLRVNRRAWVAERHAEAAVHSGEISILQLAVFVIE